MGETVKRQTKTLIVDDSTVMLEMIESMLHDCGISDITPAEDGLSALQCFQDALQDGSPVSLVFLDSVMPLLDGQEALRRMRGMEGEAGLGDDDRAVIIMTTALHSPEDMLHALIDGDCSDYLVKPFEKEDIQGMLQKYGFLDQPGL